MRNMQQPDFSVLVCRYSRDEGLITFSIKIQFNVLFEGDEYKELASLAMLLLSISPTSVICERGFSVMNYVKNQY